MYVLYQGYDISCGHCQDIGTGDLVPALRHRIHGRLGLDDRVKPVSGQREVVGVVFLGLVVAGGRHYDGSVTTLQSINQNTISE